MNLLINILGLVALVAIALLGILGSGLLAARRIAETNDSATRTDTPERNTES